jgi:hypothetical protein
MSVFSAFRVGCIRIGIAMTTAYSSMVDRSFFQTDLIVFMRYLPYNEQFY